MFYDFKEIRDRAQAARRRELEKLFGATARALAYRADRVIRSATAQASRNPSFAAAYTASVRLRASSARSTEER